MRWLIHILGCLLLAAILTTPVFARDVASADSSRLANPSPAPAALAASLAASYAGYPYRWGGASPSGFDCSGLVLWVFSQFGVGLDHDESSALRSGTPVTRDALVSGDVVVFAGTYKAGPSHVGIYLGDGRFVHAVDEAHGVLVSSLDNPYWSDHFYAASRLLPSGDGS